MSHQDKLSPTLPKKNLFNYIVRTVDIVESVKEGDDDLDEVKSRLRGLEKAVAAVLRRLDEL